MRRKVCEVTDLNRIREILASTNIGRLATNGADGYPYITPVNFVLLKDNIYFHTALKGEKLDNIQKDPHVCFEVDVPLSYLEVGFNPENDPCRTHQLFHCVIIRGKAKKITDEKMKIAALTALVEKHEKTNNFKSVADSQLYKSCGVVEIIPDTITAKSDVAQGRKYNKYAAEKMVDRGRPEDIETVKAMGFELQFDPENEKYNLKD